MDPFLRFELKNRRPVDLLDLTASLSAFGEAYQEYIVSAGFDVERGNVRLYIRDIKSGSIIADLAPYAEQASFVFKYVEAGAAFLTHFNEISQFFLGLDLLEKPTKKEAEQVMRVFEPVAKDGGSQLFVNVNGNVEVHTHYNYNSQAANAIQNGARRYLGPKLPAVEVRHNALLKLHQVRGDAASKAGDRGIIEEVSPDSARVRFATEEAKSKVLDEPYPFELLFLVDVEVKAFEGKVALYDILSVMDVL